IAGVAAAQGVGSIEFVARVTPTVGRAEPVRQITFYLLRKSYAETVKEVEQSEEKPEMDRFIAGLEVSKELKAWMKKNHWVQLAGPEFTRRLKTDDILDVPEFYDACLRRNVGDEGIGFPPPSYRERDRQENPQRYEKQRQEYRTILRRFLENNKPSIEGIDLYLDTINPGSRWALQEAELRLRIRKRALQLAETRDLVAKSETDLDGRGVLPGILPGAYWLSTLETEAIAGDTHLRWDAPVTVRSGLATRLELSYLNAVEPARNATTRP
ncbi:MAG: hypothetical protein WAR21_02715, partial [Candidatus Acidiferrales bacterium]